MTPLSVVVITHNQEHSLPEALESILAQRTEQPYELVVADDASTDRTPEIVKAYAQRYPELIRPILRPKNLGAQKNFIDAYNQCKDGLVALLEGDDAWLTPLKLDAQVAAMTAHPQAAVCGMNAWVFDEKDPARSHFHPGHGEAYLADASSLLESNFFSTCTLMLRKQGPIDVPAALRETWGDWALKLHFALKGDVLFLPEVGGMYRLTGHGLWTQQSPLEKERSVLNVLLAFQTHVAPRFGPLLQARIHQQLQAVLAASIQAGRPDTDAFREALARLPAPLQPASQRVTRRGVQLPVRQWRPGAGSAVSDAMARAVSLLEAGANAAALTLIDGARVGAPPQAELEQLRALALMPLGFSGEALACARRAVQLAPENPALFQLWLGLCARLGLSKTPFFERLLMQLDRDAAAEQERNVDPFRFPKGPEYRPTMAHAADYLERAHGQGVALERTYAALADETSKALMVEVTAFRALGYRRVKLSRNDAKYWDALAQADGPLVKERNALSGPFAFPMHRFDLSAAGFPLTPLSASNGVALLFLLKQYAFSRGGVEIGARPGDVVMDLGACWGDSALYFAHLVGPTGQVQAFEFHPDNLAVYRRNLELHPELAGRIHLVEAAAWHASGERLSYRSSGPGTRVTADGSQDSVATTLSVDALVDQRGLPRVDFLKLDIEGSELNALRGAEATLRRFRPRLAISVYHRDSDLAELPAFVEQLGLGYRLYLDHFTIHAEEMVLFAIAG